MLIDTHDLCPDFQERIRIWGLLDVPIAQDPRTGAQLTVSHGRRAAGRARQYYIWRPVAYLPGGHYGPRAAVGKLTAASDEEAIAKANARLAKEGLAECLTF